MCGIFGCVGQMHMDKAYECIHRIAHRGPDALAVKPLKGIVLAHARLSILDTSVDANQPMPDQSGRYWIVYNGEIYNFLELRQELKYLGYNFRTDGDTEVVLYSYIEWGEDFQKKCNGMWSLAIWDNVKEELFLSRDRFGIKPLYYYREDNNFYFASEIKAFFPIMKEKNINYNIFEKGDYLGFESTQECCVRDVKKIQAGYYGYLREGTLSLYRWWNTLDNLMEISEKYEEQVKYLRGLLLDACRIRMRSDVPIGTALSGGLDSSAVVGCMKYISAKEDVRVMKDWQHTFVASMPGTMIDETMYAKKAAEYVNVDLQEVHVTAKISPDEIFHYLYICEEPYTTSPIPFLQTYGFIANSGVHVTLDGHGADELFGGYRAGIYAAAKGCRQDQDKFVQIWRTYNDILFPENKMTLEEFTECVDKRRFESSRDEEHDNWKNMSEYNRRLYIETHEKILPTLLRCYDRYSMGNGVEIRMPFLDYRIVCFAFSLPWTSKLRNGYTKSVLRDASAMFMDSQIIYRKRKVGFNSPLTDWFQTDLKEFVLDTIHSKDFYECELIDSLEVSKKVMNFFQNSKGYFNEGELLWRELLPYFWKKAVISGKV